MGEPGRKTYFALDDPAGVLQNISGTFRRVSGLPGTADRPETGGFGEDALRYEGDALGKREFGPISIGGKFKTQSGLIAHGRMARFLIDEFALYGALRTLSLSRSVPVERSDGFGDDWVLRGENGDDGVIGKATGSLAVGGKFENAAGLTDPTFWAMLAAIVPAVATLGPRGLAIGSLVELLSPYTTRYGIDSDHLTGPIPVSVDMVPDGLIDLGVSLHDLVAETVLGTTNYTGVDEAASTALGWVAHLTVTAFSGWTDATIKVQDSADGAAWADLAGATFVAVTAAGKQRLVGAAAATVRRHVRAVCTTTGVSGSVTFNVSLARRGSTYGAAGTYRHLYELFRHANTQTFQYGPGGNASGKRRYTGECRLSKLDLSIDHTTGPTELMADLLSHGALTRDTF